MRKDHFQVAEYLGPMSTDWEKNVRTVLLICCTCTVWCHHAAGLVASAERVEHGGWILDGVVYCCYHRSRSRC